LFNEWLAYSALPNISSNLLVTGFLSLVAVVLFSCAKAIVDPAKMSRIRDNSLFIAK
jgi:hypothetical protein